MDINIGDVLATITKGFQATEGAIISAVASFSISEIIKLTIEAAQQINDSLKHFISNLRAGMAWGAAQASMLTELWNDTKSDLADLATDFVNAVGKVFQSVGLIASAA